MGDVSLPDGVFRRVMGGECEAGTESPECVGVGRMVDIEKALSEGRALLENDDHRFAHWEPVVTSLVAALESCSRRMKQLDEVAGELRDEAKEFDPESNLAFKLNRIADSLESCSRKQSGETAQPEIRKAWLEGAEYGWFEHRDNRKLRKITGEFHEVVLSDADYYATEALASRSPASTQPEEEG